MATPCPDYYEILKVSPTASFQSILKAYQQQALRLHPELHPQDGVTEAAFQSVNEAFFILSDGKRKKKYDAVRQSYLKQPQNQTIQKEMQSMFLQFFGSMNPSSTISHVFDDVFAPLLSQELNQENAGVATSKGSSTTTTLVETPRTFWGILGTIAGMILGLIIANIPGATMGAAAGYKLGQVRDRSGKAVIEVWHGMSTSQRRTILGRLARKILL
jgi:hypothetical protein